MNSITLRSFRAAFWVCFWLCCGTASWAQTGQKSYGGSDQDYGTNIAPTNDGGYVIIGSSQSSPSQNGDALLTKFNSTNQVEWSQVYGTSDFNEVGKLVIPSTDGGYLIVFQYSELGSTRTVVAKTDSKGMIINQSVLQDGLNNEFTEGIKSGVQLQTGEFFLFGNLQSNEGIPAIWGVKVDKDGTNNGNFQISSSPNTSNAHSCCIANDGTTENILICGNSNESEGLIIKYNTTEQKVLWTKTYGYIGSFINFNAIVADNNSIKVAASFTTDNNEDASVLHLDADGKLISGVVVGNEGIDYISAIQMSNGEALVYGASAVDKQNLQFTAMAASINSKGGLSWANKYQNVDPAINGGELYNYPNVVTLTNGEFASVATNDSSNTASVDKTNDVGVTRFNNNGASSCGETALSFSSTKNLTTDDQFVISDADYSITQIEISTGDYIAEFLPINLSTVNLCKAGDCSFDVSVASVVNPNCPNDLQGVVQLTDLPEAVKKTAIMSLDGANFKPFNTFEVADVGTHRIICLYNETCLDTVDFEIVAPPRFVINLSSINPTGVSTNDGSITVNNVLNASAPFQYKITGGSFSGSSKFTGLDEGTYCITVRDSKNCVDSLCVTLESVKCRININATTTNITCAGTPTGCVNIATLSGKAPFEYSIDGGTNYSSGTTSFCNLPAATYFIATKDADGCIGRDTVTITETGTPIVIENFNSQRPDCGGSNGLIEIIATGDNLQYSIDGGISFVSENIFTDLPSGLYSVIVKDVNGCTRSEEIPLYSTGTFNVATEATPATCFGISDAKFTVKYLDGNQPFQYSIDGKVFQSDSTFTNQDAPRTITVYVVDASGCLVTQNVDLTAPDEISAVVDKMRPRCSTDDNGMITIMASGGNSPYTYSLDGTNFQVGNMFMEQSEPKDGSGIITVFVKDANGCIVSFEEEYTAENVIRIDSIRTKPSGCGVGNGIIQIYPSGTGGGFEFSIDGTNYKKDGLFSGLNSGKYFVYLRNSAGCIVRDSAIVESLGGLKLAFAFEQPKCFNSTDGSITVVASGGSQPYQFKIGNEAFSSNNKFSNRGKGTYQISVRDANGCQTDTTYILSGPSDITATLDNTDPTCGSTNGVIRITAKGGSGEYEYSISKAGGPWTNSNIFSQIACGDYEVWVRDGFSPSCMIKLDTKLNCASDFTITPTTTNPKCFGEETGKISVAVTGETGPFSYKITPGSPNYQASPDFTGLTGGKYLITVKTSNDCTDTTSVTLTSAPEIVINITNQNPSCATSQNGSITINATGGAGGFQYSRDSITFTGSGVFSGLGIGTYKVYAKDINGCIKGNEVLLTASGSIVVDSVKVVDADCGQTNGSIRISAQGSNLQYSIDNGTTFQASNTFNNLVAGLYVVIVKDAGCSSEPQNVRINNLNTNVQVELDVVNPSCTGGTPGQVTVNATGGETPYEYSKDGSNFDGNNVFTGVTLGTFTAYVKDASGCVAIKTVEVTGSQGPSVEVLKENPSCPSASNGSVSLIASGGVEPYTYSEDSINFSSKNFFLNLPIGTRKFFTKDGSGCLTVTNVTLESTGGVQIDTILIKDATCNSGNGQITVKAINGSGNYQYALNNPFYQNDSVFSNLSPNNHTVYVLDLTTGCSVNQSITVGTKADLDITFTVFSPTCDKPESGALQINAIGGIEPYEYSTDSKKITFTKINLLPSVGAGTYMVYVRDAFGCLDSAEVTVTPYQEIISTFTVLQKPGCGDVKTGRFRVSSEGGSGVYSYSLDDSNYSFNNTFEVPAGDYKVYTKDLNGCYGDTLTVNFPSIDSIAIESVEVQAPKCGKQDGMITILAFSGGKDEILYSIDGKNYSTVNKFDSLASGLYTLYIKNVDGCILEEKFQLFEEGEFEVTLNSKNPSCSTSDNGEIIISSVTGGVSPYVFSIDGSTFIGDSSFNELAGGVYILYVRDATGCQYVESVNIEAPTDVEASTTKVEPTCYGIPTGSITITATGGFAPYQYSLDGVSFQSNNTINGLVIGNYQIFIRDGNGCTNVIFDTLKVADGRIPVEVTEITIANPRCEGVSNGRVRITAKGGNPPYTYSLDGINYQKNPNFLSLGIGDYTVYIKDADTCGTSEPVKFTLKSRSGEMIKDVIVSRQDCQSVSSASIKVVASSEFEGVLYSLDGLTYQTNPQFNGLPNGTYTVRVKYVNGCVATKTVDVQPSDNVTIKNIDVTNVSCNGNKNGSFTVVAESVDNNVVYSINGTDYQNSNKFTDLAAGIYTVSVRSLTGCIANQNVIISEPSAITFGEPFITEPLCEKNNDGLIRITATGGTGKIMYAVNGGGFSENNEFTNLLPKIYTVTAKDENGCISYTTIDLKASQGMTITLSKVDASNFDATDASITVQVADGKGPFTYSIDGVNFTEGNQFFELGVGFYTITVRDFNGCEKVVTTRIENRNNSECSAPTAVMFDRITLNSAIVTWTPVKGSKRYQLRYRILGNQDWTNLVLNTNVAQVTGLIPNSIYEVQVRNVCETNMTSPYTNAKFSTNGGCEAPLLAEVIPTTTTAEIKWNATANAVVYTLSYRTAGTGNWTNIQLPGTATSITIASLKPGQRYSLRFKTQCNNAETPWTYTYSFMTLTGREGDVQTTTSNEVNVYPNPNKGSFVVKFNSTSTSEAIINIVDVTGRNVLSQTTATSEGLNELPVSLSGYTSGVYFLQVTLNGETLSQRIVIE